MADSLFLKVGEHKVVAWSAILEAQVIPAEEHYEHEDTLYLWTARQTIGGDEGSPASMSTVHIIKGDEALHVWRRICDRATF